MYLGAGAVGGRGSRPLGQVADGQLTAGGSRPPGSTRPVVVGGRGGWDLRIYLRRQLADGSNRPPGQLADGAVVTLFIAVTTAFTRMMEQYYLQKSYLVLL